MIAIIDYGVGNLYSLKSSLNALGIEAIITSDEKTIRNASKIILPGVGAFADAFNKLAKSGLKDIVVREAEGGKPLLGICVGMQMLFERDYEFGVHEGLALIDGEVRDIKSRIGEELKVPHIGWNKLTFRAKKSRLFKGVAEGSYVYFVHSYSAVGCEPYVTAYADYGVTLTAAVEKDNVYGTQFHPEKSGDIGLRILANFNEI